MTMLATLIPAALTKTQSAFVSEHPGFHLLKPPTTAEEQPLHYQTLQVTEIDGLPPEHIIPSANAWQSTPVRKRPGNPYPERISVGRATNCDIVLRFAVVSKLHAHFTLRPDGFMQLSDLGSSNGTWHNGRRLERGQRVLLSPNDHLSFGGVCCELVDAVGLYEKVSGRRKH
jgi:hypothetical protein